MPHSVRPLKLVQEYQQVHQLLLAHHRMREREVNALRIENMILQHTLERSGASLKRGVEWFRQFEWNWER